MNKYQHTGVSAPLSHRNPGIPGQILVKAAAIRADRKQAIAYYRCLLPLLFALLCVSGLFSQEKEENIGTETVDVVRPYRANISDAFKVREMPVLDDSVLLKKKEINYNIFSVPVASTFVPARGKVAGIEKKRSEQLYNSYLSLGLGNYSTALLDFHTSMEISRDESLDIGLNHHSAQAQLSQTDLDTKFFDTRLEATYGNSGRFYRWGINGGLQHQIYNWYGMPVNLFDEAVINSIDERQTYYGASLGATLEAVEESIFTGGELSLRRFWDAHDSGENRAVLKPSFGFSVGEEEITAHVFADYVGGEFKHDYVTGEKLKYSNLLLGVNPNLVISGEDFSINLGASVFYGMDMENSDNSFYIYPQVKASYRLVEEYVTVYGGVEGSLDQNSYYDFVQDNVYVSPTLVGIMPTDRQYDAYVGMKGKLSANVGYNLKGSYRAENNKPMFLANPVTTASNETRGYAFGNSFGVVYDDVTTFSAFGEIHADIGRNLTLGMNAEVFGYDTDSQAEAWNLPIVKGSFFGDYQIGERWFAGANIFYVGQRKDLYTPPSQVMPEPEVVKLDAYFDVNARLGYRVTDQWTVFARANNIANNQYARWMNYPVQGFQILGGVSYKFDL